MSTTLDRSAKPKNVSHAGLEFSSIRADRATIDAVNTAARAAGLPVWKYLQTVIRPIAEASTLQAARDVVRNARRAPKKR